MQRQSLGSPSSSSSKILKNEQQFPSSSPTAFSYGQKFECRNEDDEVKKLKATRRNISESESVSYVHIIPLLTLLCFLILYLSSHHPSQYDLAQFSGSKISSFSEDNISELKKGDILGIRSLKNLDAAAAARMRRRHRKMVGV